jgi:anti-anti-sigma regulatory factor
MPFIRLELDGYIYIGYRRNDFHDFNKYRDVLEQVSRKDDRDIVVDFSFSDTISEGEVGVLMSVVKAFQGTSRQLRIISSPALYKRFQNRNLHRADNVLFYQDHEFLQSDLNTPN